MPKLLDKYPTLLVIAPTGGGKSHFVRGVADRYFADFWDLDQFGRRRMDKWTIPTEVLHLALLRATEKPVVMIGLADNYQELWAAAHEEGITTVAVNPEISSWRRRLRTRSFASDARPHDAWGSAKLEGHQRVEGLESTVDYYLSSWEDLLDLLADIGALSEDGAPKFAPEQPDLAQEDE